MRSNKTLKAEMYGFINRWKHSGLNQKEFCKAEGINYYKFKYWKTQQSKDQHFSAPIQVEPKPGFIEVGVPDFENTISGLVISFPNGVRLNCNQGLQASQIKELIKLY